MSQTVHIVSLGLSASGVLLLGSIILQTAINRSSASHPAFLNNLFSWTLWSVHLTYTELTNIALDLKSVNPADPSGILRVQHSMRDMLWLITQFATLNLVIHIWRMMGAVLHGEDTEAKLHSKSYILLLLISPYVFGLIPLAELFYPYKRIFGIENRWALSIPFLVLCLVTVLFDVAILILFWKNRIRLRLAAMPGIMSMSLFTKLLTFCLVRVGISIVCAILISNPYGSVSGDLIEITESSYPLIVFFMCFERQFRKVHAAKSHEQQIRPQFQVDLSEGEPTWRSSGTLYPGGSHLGPVSLESQDSGIMV